MVQVNPWRRFLKLLQIEKKDIYAIYFYAIAGGILSMSLPLGIQSVIRFIQSGQITTSWVVLIVLVIAGAILTGVMQIMQLRITENIQQRIFVNYSFDFAHRFPRFKRNETVRIRMNWSTVFSISWVYKKDFQKYSWTLLRLCFKSFSVYWYCHCTTRFTSRLVYYL
jgi:ABC-type multidrug transport system fused ATPase/permease subunit